MILVGFLYRLILTSEGNFIFNMDNARDMIDVRGMVELGKWRLIGPTTGIDGVYTGPGWYYLLVIPYFFSGGNPYSSILMMIIFWTVGAILIGVVLRTKGVYAVISAMTVWSFAPSIILVTQYALNPNPVVLLAPLLVYVLYHYLKSGSIVYYLFAWMFAGLYFNLEMAAGICVPAVIITVSLLRNGLKDLFSRRLIVGVITMSIFCIPQVVFELRHDFFMSKAILSHLLEPGSYNFFDKFIGVLTTYKNVLFGTFFNNIYVVVIWGILSIVVLFRHYKNNNVDDFLKVLVVMMFIPLIIHLILPVNVMPWHLGLWVVSTVFLAGYIMGEKDNFFSTSLKTIFCIALLAVGIQSSSLLSISDLKESNRDPSLFKNQIEIIDLIYEKAENKDFKVYTHIPSVYDYQYQYLFWWWGKNTYGYLPSEYAYAPHAPEYIKNKNNFNESPSRDSSGLVFLIKEKTDARLENLWLNQFIDNKVVAKMMVGALELEIRNEKPK
jgi:hypothetical protein